MGKFTYGFISFKGFLVLLYSVKIYFFNSVGLVYPKCYCIK